MEISADDVSNEPFMKKSEAKENKHTSYARRAPPKWTKKIPVFVRAMAKSESLLLAAGASDRFDETDPFALYEGTSKGTLLVLSPEDGKTLHSVQLSSQPVFDGIAVGRDLILISLMDGNVICLR